MSRNIRTNKGVVLAAGSGTRIRATFSGPKPLIPLGGVPIVVRTLDALAENGVQEICVVTGHRAEELSQGLEPYLRERQLSVTFVHNSRWTEPNGLSVRAAQTFTAGDDFILCMADHLLAPEIIGILQQAPPRCTLLAIDEQVDRVLDLDDATKVRCDSEHRILAIGKTISPADAIDCGAFLCTDEIHEALDRTFERGEHSLSGGMQILADRRRLHGVPIGNHYWQDIDTPEMYEAAQTLAQQHDERPQ